MQNQGLRTMKRSFHYSNQHDAYDRSVSPSRKPSRGLLPGPSGLQKFPTAYEISVKNSLHSPWPIGSKLETQKTRKNISSLQTANRWVFSWKPRTAPITTKNRSRHESVIMRPSVPLRKITSARDANSLRKKPNRALKEWRIRCPQFAVASESWEKSGWSRKRLDVLSTLASFCLEYMKILGASGFRTCLCAASRWNQQRCKAQLCELLHKSACLGCSALSWAL